MKKLWNYLLLATAALVLSLVFFPRTAHAEWTFTYQIDEVTPGQYTDMLTYTHDEINEVTTDHLYSIVVPKGTYMKFETTENNDISFYYNRQKGSPIGDFSVYNGKLFGSSAYPYRNVFYRALKPGTYYFHFAHSGGQFRITFPDVTRQKNYCKKYAASLKKGKTVIIANAYGYECTRWYKIKLKKKQKVTLVLEGIDMETDLSCIAALNFTRTNLSKYFTMTYGPGKGAKTYTSNGVLPAGTYYFTLERTGDFGFDTFPIHDIYSLTWK